MEAPGEPARVVRECQHKFIFLSLKIGDLMRIRDVIKLVEADGWYLTRTEEAIGNL
jgi:hypothetical protein